MTVLGCPSFRLMNSRRQWYRSRLQKSWCALECEERLVQHLFSPGRAPEENKFRNSEDLLISLFCAEGSKTVSIQSEPSCCSGFPIISELEGLWPHFHCRCSAIVALKASTNIRKSLGTRNTITLYSLCKQDTA
jgi:hypothetical protein